MEVSWKIFGRNRNDVCG